MKIKLSFLTALAFFSAFLGSSNQYTSSEFTHGSSYSESKQVRNISRMINFKKLNLHFSTAYIFSFEKKTVENYNAASVITSASLIE